MAKPKGDPSKEISASKSFRDLFKSSSGIRWKAMCKNRSVSKKNFLILFNVSDDYYNHLYTYIMYMSSNYVLEMFSEKMAQPLMLRLQLWFVMGCTVVRAWALAEDS